MVSAFFARKAALAWVRSRQNESREIQCFSICEPIDLNLRPLGARVVTGSNPVAPTICLFSVTKEFPGRVAIR